LNPAVPTEEIRRYVAYTEGVEYGQTDISPFFIGQANDTAYFFYYDPDRATALDFEFLASLRFAYGKRPETLVIYADNCLLSPEQLNKHGIIFKKIPRDVTRF
jgi:adenine-specific DNA-methyltransferase